MNLSTGDIGAFTLNDVMEYFTLLRKGVQYEPPLPEVTEEDAKRILDATQGVPLAVKFAAGIYMETAKLETITENMEGKRQLVDEMVRRYLLHTIADQSERAKLYGLAMLRRADQNYAVATALGLTPEQAKTDFVNQLSLLHRRYSFIFTQKEEPSLHQEVRHFLRLWLLEHRTEPEIVAVNKLLKEAHETALKQLEERRRYGNLKDRLQDDAWVGIYLDLTEQQFWFDPVEGVRYAVPFMVAASIYRRNINQGVAEVGKFFAAEIVAPYRDWWDRATQNLTASENAYVTYFAHGESGLEKLLDLINQGRLDFPSPVPALHEELEGVLCWRLGETYRYDDDMSLDLHEKALAKLKYEDDIKEATAEMYYTVADRLDDAIHGRPNIQIIGGMKITTQGIPIRYANPLEKSITFLNP